MRKNVRQRLHPAQDKNPALRIPKPHYSNTDKPRQKFLCLTVAAILLSGCLVVKELTRWIHFAEANLRTDIVFCKVNLRGNKKPLYVVAGWRKGRDETLILLTTLVAENLQQAEQIMCYYKQRWVCEGAGQLFKSRVGFERFRIRRYVAIQRLAILAIPAMGFLIWVLLRSCCLVKILYGFTTGSA